MEGGCALAPMTFVSHQTNQITGYPASDWITDARSAWDLAIRKISAAALKYCAADEAREDYNFEYRMITPQTGADFRWRVAKMRWSWSQNRPVTLRGVMVDITRRRKNWNRSRPKPILRCCKPHHRIQR